jgi:hypothetical protein
MTAVLLHLCNKNSSILLIKKFYIYQIIINKALISAISGF